MAIKDDLENVKKIPLEMLSQNHKMVLVLSASFYLAGKMATVNADEEGAATMREALGVFYETYRAMFPDGPLAAQEAVQEFANMLGVGPDAKEAVH